MMKINTKAQKKEMAQSIANRLWNQNTYLNKAAAKDLQKLNHITLYSILGKLKAK